MMAGLWGFSSVQSGTADTFLTVNHKMQQLSLSLPLMLTESSLRWGWFFGWLRFFRLLLHDSSLLQTEKPAYALGQR